MYLPTGFGNKEPKEDLRKGGIGSIICKPAVRVNGTGGVYEPVAV